MVFHKIWILKKKTMQQVQIIIWNLKEEYTYSVAVPLLIMEKALVGLIL